MSSKDTDPPQETPTLDYAKPERRSGFSIVTTLIVVNALVFLLQFVSARLGQTIFVYGAMHPLLVIKGESWRLITAQYLHANEWHLLVNMIALHFLGRPLEEKWSPWRLLGVYTACGLAGNVFYVILAWRGVISPLDTAVGASGCIYGLLGIVAIMFPGAKLYIYGLIPIRIRPAAIIMAVIAFMTVVERGQNFGGQACHLAGLVFGVWWGIHGDEWWTNTEWALPWSKRKKE